MQQVLDPSLCVAGPRLEEDAELRGNGGGVKMVNDDLDLEPVNAKVRPAAHKRPTLLDYLGVHDNITRKIHTNFPRNCSRSWTLIWTQASAKGTSTL